MSVAFGVPQMGNNGTTAHDMRHIIAGEWDNPGVVSGLYVEGFNNQYEVNPGLAICCRNKSDGYTKAYYPGGRIDNVALNPSADRIDAIWISANDHTQGDTDNRVHVGVVIGAPSATPAPPTIPSGKTLICYMHVPAGCSSLANASPLRYGYNFAVQSGGSLGILADRTYTVNDQMNQDEKELTWAMCRINVPTRRILNIRMMITVMPVGTLEKNNHIGLVTTQYRIDGIAKNKFRNACFKDIVETFFYEDTVVVTAGEHKVTASMWPNPNPPECGLRLMYIPNDIPGQRLIILDGGPVGDWQWNKNNFHTGLDVGWEPKF